MDATGSIVRHKHVRRAVGLDAQALAFPQPDPARNQLSSKKIQKRAKPVPSSAKTVAAHQGTIRGSVRKESAFDASEKRTHGSSYSSMATPNRCSVKTTQCLHTIFRADRSTAANMGLCF